MLKNISQNAGRFFEILPKDWQDSIVPYWKDLENSTQVYIIEEGDQIIVGGMVFSNLIPEMKEYTDEANCWFLNNYLYIGYLWVPENKRGKNLGSTWLQELRALNKNQKYWLTIEEHGLGGFYLKNNFKYIKTLELESTKEELFAD